MNMQLRMDTFLVAAEIWQGTVIFIWREVACSMLMNRQQMCVRHTSWLLCREMTSLSSDEAWRPRLHDASVDGTERSIRYDRTSPFSTLNSNVATLTLWLPNKIFRNCCLAPNEFLRFSPLAPNKIFGFSLQAPNKIWPSTFSPTTDYLILFYEKSIGPM